jgi:glycine/D-amino acid oxidase-like deaminating enzyme
MNGGALPESRNRDPLRIVVVGAGITGLLASIRCVQAGHRVVLLDRGPIPHPESTSFDQHRALRALNVGDPASTGRAALLHSRWQGIDSLLRDHPAGAPLYRRVGVLTALPHGEVSTAVSTAEAAGLPIRVADPADYPHIRFPPGTGVVLEPHAGVLLADRVLRAAVRWLRGQSLAELRPGSEVVEVRADTGGVRLADGTAETGDVVLVTAGPWSAALLGLPVTVHRQTMVYLQPPADLVRNWAVTPIAGGIGGDGRSWLLPAVTGTLVKISTDAARREVSTLSNPGDEGDWTDRVLAADVLSDQHRYRVVLARHCHYTTAAGGYTGFVQVGSAAWARPASGGDGFRTAPQAVDTIAGELASRGAGLTASIP